MKFLSSLILSFSIVACYGQVVIDGMITNYDGKSTVSYAPTRAGIIPVMGRTGGRITPRRNGEFQIKLAEEGFGTLRLYFGGLTYAFFHSGGTVVDLVIDQDKIRFPKKRFFEYTADSVKQLATVSIGGDFASVNRYYNRALRSSSMTLSVSGCYYSRLAEKIDSPMELVDFMDSLRQRELNEIKLLESGHDGESSIKPMTAAVRSFLENQVHAFYGSVFLSAMTHKRVDQASKSKADPTIPLRIYNADWERLTEKFFAEAAGKLFPAANSFEYNEFVYRAAYTLDTYQEYVLNETPLKTNDEMVTEILMKPRFEVLDSLSLVDEKTILAYQLQFLAHFLTTQTYYSPVLLNAVRALKVRYPDSPHLPLYDEDIARLELYLKTSSADFDKARIIDVNYPEFSELVKTFRGQNLFIDVWATWCGPCVEDFNFKSVLKPFIDSGQIVPLYISIDKPVWRKKWKENMRFNQLEGYHVLADAVLINDMWDFLGDPQGMIPRYALIDKNGALIIPVAASPREGEKLAAQIRQLINSQ